MSEKSHSTCNGMVQHVTLGRLWSASKMWRRDLKPVSSCLKALCEFQAVPSRPKLWGPCEKPSAGLHQGPGPSYLIANNDYYNKAVVRGEEREHKIFVTFRESSQKVLEPLAWLGSGWRILDLPLLIFVSAVDPRHSVGMLASRQQSSHTHWLWHTHLHGHVAFRLQVGDGLV
ncbi:hypothetical protein B0H14DRAFT_2580225 [Mycena olivaceomarginata]|nr:hypothetical protein B0H14DRAFT_2580225 [Mycena olivaceomarginata]